MGENTGALQIIFSWATKEIISHAINTTVTIGICVMIPWSIKRFRRRNLRPLVEKAYVNLRGVVEPKTMNPDNPGNPDFMRSASRDEINMLLPKLMRAKFPTPAPMDLTNESAHDWFRTLGQIRTQL